MGQTLSNFNEVIGERDSFNKNGTIRPATWQTPGDRPHRIEMIHTLLEILDSKLHHTIPKKQLTNIARLLELALYRRANSLAEYIHSKSLEKRLEYLALVGYPPSSRLHDGNDNRKSSEKRGLEAKSIDTAWEAATTMTTVQPKKKARFTTKRPPFILYGHEDILDHIFGYLDGVEVIWLSAINRFAASFLPKCVRKLTLSSAQVDRIYFQSSSGGQFTKCSQLQELLVRNHSFKPEHTDYGKSMYESRMCHQCYSCTRSNAEDTMSKLASTFRAGNFPKLEKLSLVSVFFNSMRFNAVKDIALALESRSCPQLTHINVAGNGIGDAGAVHFARLLEKGSCPELEHIDLRNNYIGEKGITAISKAIKHGACTNLKRFCFGGNIATGSGGLELAEALDSRSLPSLEFLGLDTNFLDDRSIFKISSALESGCCPRLRQLHLGNNDTGEKGARSLVALVNSANCPLLQYVDAGKVTMVNAINLIEAMWKKKGKAELHYVVEANREVENDDDDEEDDDDDDDPEASI